MRSQIHMTHPSETRDTPVSAANPEGIDGLQIDEILRRAQEIHHEHGGAFGYDFEDWLQAWEELPKNPVEHAEFEIGAVVNDLDSNSDERTCSCSCS